MAPIVISCLLAFSLIFGVTADGSVTPHHHAEQPVDPETAIARSPTGHEAITVLRVIERDIARAKLLHGTAQGEIISSAAANLEQAWTNLEEKNYPEAISQAKQGQKLLGDLQW